MLTDEIRNNWNSDIVGYAQPILSLTATGFPAWTIKFSDSYGVAIPYDGALEINENFSNARIYSSIIRFNSTTDRRALLLTTEATDIIVPFSALCAELVDPGENGVFRKEIINSPLKWWREWKELLGNRSVDDRVYDVLGELCVLNKLLAMGEEANWNGPSGASYDIETDKRFIEVKSSIVKDRKEITISNYFQLNPPGKSLDIVFCQFEPSVNSGVSINKIIDELNTKGINVGYINQKLRELGFEEGKSSRNKTFILHDMLKYTVDTAFPRITPASFIGGVIPAGISKITYTVDLSGISAESMIQGDNNDI
jgi:hypothetical protein